MGDVYDVIIIGAGAAGLSAAIYTCRRKLNTLVVSIDIGGQTILATHIENYPGVRGLLGTELMQVFHEQALSFGAEFIGGKVIKIEEKNHLFSVALSNGEEYKAKALILAFGKEPKMLGIPGEDKFLGRGVSTCATCDAPLFSDKDVAVIGGGNSAIDAALLLSKIAKKVYLVHRRDEFRGDEHSVGKIKKSKNVELVLDSLPVEVKGEKFVSSVVVENVKTGKKEEIKADGVFVEIGYITKTELVKDIVKLNEKKEIITDEFCMTSCPGIFAAGDVTNVPFKQTVVSAGEGAKAGLAVYRYLQGKDVKVVDWKHA